MILKISTSKWLRADLNDAIINDAEIPDGIEDVQEIDGGGYGEDEVVIWGLGEGGEGRWSNIFLKK